MCISMPMWLCVCKCLCVWKRETERRLDYKLHQIVEQAAFVSPLNWSAYLHLSLTHEKIHTAEYSILTIKLLFQFFIQENISNQVELNVSAFQRFFLLKLRRERKKHSNNIKRNECENRLGAVEINEWPGKRIDKWIKRTLLPREF